MTLEHQDLNSFEVKNSQSVQGELGAYVDGIVEQGAVALVITGRLVDERTKYSIQCGAKAHLEPLDAQGNPTPGYYINHSCDPNTFIKPVQTSDRDYLIYVMSRRELKLGEEITLDYASMEYTTTIDGTSCLCGSPNCRSVITGYRDLPTEIKNRYLREAIIPQYLIEQDLQ